MGMQGFSKVIVFGGTGFYGRIIVKDLLRQGAVVRVLSRNEISAQRVLGDGVQIIEGDVRNPDTVRNALEGMDAVLIALSAMHWKLIRWQKAIERDAVLDILRAAQDQGIRRIVYLSGYEIRRNVLEQLGIPEFGAIKWEIEKALEATDLNWTILGCPPSFELFFTFLNRGRLTVPGGGKNPIPTIAPEDVGTIAAKALLRNDLKGRRFRLTGPRAYSMPEAAALMQELSGKPVGHLVIPLAGIRIAGRLVQPFNPFLRELYKSILLLNHFPPDLVAKVPEDHQLLLDTFDYVPHSLETEILRRL